MKKLNIGSFVFLFLLVAFSLHTEESSIPSILAKSSALKVMYALTDIRNNCLITPLKGGMSNAMLYKVDSGNKSYVIRFIGHRSMKDKISEIDAQIIASHEGWGPKVYASDISEGWIIIDYIEPTRLTDVDRADEQLYISLGKCLQQIHSGKSFLPGKLRIIENEELLHQLKEQDKIPSSINYQTLKNIIESIRKNYSTNFTPTHRDLNPNNILFSNKQPFIIDFESAAQDDPFFDLGVIGIFYIFNCYHESVYLNAYFNRLPTQQEYTHYQRMKIAALLFYGINFLTFVPQEVIANVSVSTESVEKLLQAIDSGAIILTDPTDLLKIAVSMLQEAVTLFNKIKD